MTKHRQLFGTDGIRGRVGESFMMPEFITKLGWAIGHFCQEGAVIIGKDTRLSSYMLEASMQAGLVSAGVDVWLTGPIPTPAVAYLVKHNPQVAMGVVISASHNPYYDNGIKLFSSEGYKLSDDLELAIEQRLTQPMQCVDSAKFGRAKRLMAAQAQYIDYCCQIFSSKHDLKGMKIVVDCANGATYQVAPIIFEKLGADVVLIGNQPDGLNINDKVGSTHPEKLCHQVVAENAHLGVGFDGDGDRLIMVDEQGQLLDGDDILFILAKYLKPQGGIVGTLMSNFGLELAIKELGLEFCRAQVGDRYVLEQLKQKGWCIGGENSGHILDLNVATTGDGIVSALLVLSAIVTAKVSLREALSGMNKVPQVLINVPVQQKPKTLELPEIQQAVKGAEEVLADQGRVLLRPSGTEALIRVMVEGRDSSMTNRLAQELAETVKQCLG